MLDRSLLQDLASAVFAPQENTLAPIGVHVLIVRHPIIVSEESGPCVMARLIRVEMVCHAPHVPTDSPANLMDPRSPVRQAMNALTG
jgi:hypothetical protein